MLLAVYDGRLARIMEKQRADLKALQTERKEAREKAVNQAAIFVEHAESNGKEYDPGEDFQPAKAYGGFEFSACRNHRPPRPRKPLPSRHTLQFP
jgi:hypothetical protein